MDLIAWIGRLVFFLLVLFLALENTATVPLRLSSTIAWQGVPLLVVILACFVAGVLAGTLALVPRLVRLSRQAVRPSAPDAAAPHLAAEQALTRAARQGVVGGDLDVETRGRR
jgi:lipopolysaccharide assembly protein A